MLPNRNQERKLIKQIKNTGVKVVSITKDSAYDSTKVEVKVGSKNFVLALERDYIDVLDLSNYQWTKYTDVKSLPF